MKTRRSQAVPGSVAKAGELSRLKRRLSEADATIRAIRSGEVDVVVVTAKQGVQMFTLENAEQTYRILIESMNEGALTLTADKTILYANQCFASMVRCPLEQLMGGSFRRFLSDEDRLRLRPLLKKPHKSGSKIQVRLTAADGAKIPVHISIRPVTEPGSKSLTIGMVVTDMTEVLRTEELLRALTNRVVEVQEAERGRVALELHDTITQMLCAVLVRSQTLVDQLPEGSQSAKGEAVKLHQIIGKTIEEVERISQKLRPSVLDHLGLVAGLHDACKEFSKRTGVPVKLVCVKLDKRLPTETELALYRILQESLQNVAKHAQARHVTVNLTKLGDCVLLTIHDDGTGFDPEHLPARRKGKGGFGLLGLRERAAFVGGVVKITSVRGKGTQIEIRIPLAKLNMPD